MSKRWASTERHPRLPVATLPADELRNVESLPLSAQWPLALRGLFALTVTMALVWPNTVSGERVTQAYAEAEMMTCGPRAVYSLARRLGCELTYDAVRKGMKINENGCSIDDVKEALVNHGVQCAVRRLDPTELRSVPTPFIVHIMPRGSRFPGHFIIVTSVEKRGLQTFDPMVNQPRFWIWRSFSDWWSGYAAVPVASPVSRSAEFVVGALGIHLLALLGLLFSVRKSLWSLLAGRGQKAVTGALGLLAIGTLTAPCTEAGEMLRSISNDGVNSAALLGGLCGVKIVPGQAAAKGACDTLPKVQSLLATYGLTTNLRSVTYDDLMHGTGPCVVSLRFGKTDTGGFYILLEADSENATVVRAGPLLVETIPLDEFRRRWTGHALIPNRNNSQTIYLAAIAGLILPACGYAIGRRRR